MRRSLNRLLLSAILLTLACTIAIPAAYAQQAQGLTAALIDQRLTALQAAGSTDDSTEATYEQARALLTQAQASEQAAEAYTRALTTAPARQDVIQARIDSMEDAYDPATELVGLTPADLNVRLVNARAQLDEMTSQLEATDRRLNARAASTTSLQTRLAEVDQLISALPDTTPNIDPMGQPSPQEAEQWRDLAEAESLQAERRALQARLASQPARYSAMITERAELAVNLESLEAMVSFLESSVTSTEEAIDDPIQLGFNPDDPAFSVAKNITDEQLVLHQEQIDLNERLRQLRLQQQRIDSASEVIDDRSGTAQRIVKFAEGSDALGEVLLTYWDELREYSIVDPLTDIPQQAGDIVISRVAHEETMAELIRASVYLNAQMRDANIDPGTVTQSSNEKLQALVRSYRQQLRSVVSTQSEYLEALSTLDSSYNSFAEELQDYRDYLESMLLWIPNHPPIWDMSTAALVADFAYAGKKLERMHYSPVLGSGVLVAAALLLLLYRRKLEAQQKLLNERISRPSNDSISYTLIALVLITLRSAPLPLIIIAFAIGIDPEASAENASIYTLIIRMVVLLFTFILMRIICEPDGVGQTHFHWPQSVVERVNGGLTSLIRWWLPPLIGAGVVHNFAPQSGDEAAGRMLLLVALFILSYHLGAPQLRELRKTGRSWLNSNLNRLRLLLSAIVLLTIYGVVVGQIFTVLVIVTVLINSVWIGVVLLLIHSVLVRWLRVARRRLRLNELLAQREEQKREEQRREEQASDEGINIEESIPDLVDISAETQQLITFATILTAAAAFIYTWAPLLPALERLSRVTLWTSRSVIDGETISNSITVATLLTIVALAAFTLFAAKRLPALVELILRSRTSVTPGARYTTSTLLNYIIVGGGIVAALSALGLQWGQLQWLVAALGVGIGFGLQEIVANFISGLIILFERPIRVGDIVTIGDKDGIVLKIRIRATTIRDWDGKELLVPNKEFITGRLLNWTLSDSHTRLEVPVGIAYGSNVEKALEILHDVVRNYPNVMEVPEPSVLFVGFGDNSLNLIARCYASRVEDRMPIFSGLHTAINRAFEDAGIVIAFPQLDIHFDPGQVPRSASDKSRPTGD